MLNNKGQSLVLFVIILPILLFILVLVIDIGKVMVLKQELNNINEIVLDYGLDKLKSNQLYNDELINSDSNNNVDSYNNDNLDDINGINRFNETDESNDVGFNNDDNIGINDLNNVDLENELINLIKLNKDDIDMINVRIDNNKIYIDLKNNVKGIFSSLVDISIFNVKSSYVGYIDNNEKRIERISGE